MSASDRENVFQSGESEEEGEFHGTLAEHVAANFDRVEERFTNKQKYEVNRDVQFMVKKNLVVDKSIKTAQTRKGRISKKNKPRKPVTRVLHAHDVNRYNYVIPHFYRRYDSIVSDIETPEFFAFLAQMPAAVPADSPVFQDKEFVDKCFRKYRLKLKPTDSQQNLIEKSLTSAVTNLMTALCENLSTATDSELDIPIVSKNLYGVTGVLCKNDGTGKIDPDAGFAGHTDNVFHYGAVDRRDEVCTIFELKMADDLEATSDAPQRRFYEQGEALFAQTISSLVGHRAELAVSMTIHGLKVFVVKTVNKSAVPAGDCVAVDSESGTQVEFFRWPPGDEFLLYRRGSDDDKFLACRFFIELTRILATPVPEESVPEFERAVKAANGTPAPTTPKKKPPTNPDEPEPKRNRLTDTEKRLSKTSQTARKRDLFAVVPSTGEKVHFRSIDIDALPSKFGLDAKSLGKQIDRSMADEEWRHSENKPPPRANLNLASPLLTL